MYEHLVRAEPHLNHWQIVARQNVVWTGKRKSEACNHSNDPLLPIGTIVTPLRAKQSGCLWPVLRGICAKTASHQRDITTHCTGRYGSSVGRRTLWRMRRFVCARGADAGQWNWSGLQKIVLRTTGKLVERVEIL